MPKRQGGKAPVMRFLAGWSMLRQHFGYAGDLRLMRKGSGIIEISLILVVGRLVSFSEDLAMDRHVSHIRVFSNHYFYALFSHSNLEDWELFG
jgi:hypothetical protein